MKVLLTGAGGFLGGTLATELEARGHEISGLGLSGRGGWPAVDLTDPDASMAAVRKSSPEVVIHLAGEASAAAAKSDPDGAFRANATTAWNLLEAVSSEAPDALFVLGSSAAVYGRPDPAIAGRIPESAPIEPVSIYGASKAAAEMVTGGYAAGARPRVAILRVFNLIGPGQHRGVGADLMDAARKGEDAQMSVKNPGAARDFTDVRDAARAITMVTEAGTEGIYNLCSGSAVRITELADAVAAAAGIGGDNGVMTGSDRPEDVLVGDPTKLQEAVGWQATIPLAESLEARLAES
jgi:GDP-4-dehydro-6-deoxy-D-mannose reductase